MLTAKQLSLFGYDVITRKETGHHAVIDVNYFPSKVVTWFKLLGYRGFPDFDKILLEFLLSKKRDRAN